MNLLEAVFLGIIQGLTEFLPISSSGHLAVFQQIFDLEDAGVSFDVFLHLGTLLAVFIVYWRDIGRLIYDGLGIVTDSIINVCHYIRWKVTKQSPEYRKVIRTAYRKFAFLIIISTVPTAIIGFIGRDLVDKASKTLIIPGVCLLITALLLVLSDSIPNGHKTPKRTTYFNALFIGLCQGIATLPGLSRSGTTITAGLLCGLRRDFVVKYSFIMSIPAIMGASILNIPDMSRDIAKTGAECYIAGALTAAIAGYVCIKTMLVIVKNKQFKYFSLYCAIVGIIAIAASFIIK